MKRYFKNAVTTKANYNIVMQITYFLSYPLACFCNILGITPNFITLLSLVLGLMSCVFLCIGYFHLFLLLFLVSYFLDYVDGSLARMSGKINKSYVCPDHYSDQVKIIFSFLSFGIYYNELSLWICFFTCSTTFLLYTLLNHDYNCVKCNLQNNQNIQSFVIGKKNKIKAKF